MKISNFIQEEIEQIIKKANFTDREKDLFDLRNKEKTLEECAEILGYSLSTVNRLNKEIKRKIMRII